MPNYSSWLLVLFVCLFVLIASQDVCVNKSEGVAVTAPLNSPPDQRLFLQELVIHCPLLQ